MDGEEEEDEMEENKAKKWWYFKQHNWVDHVRNASVALIWISETYLLLGEMIMRFYGCSLEIHQMKNKLISKG
eukprot:2570430-Ditylum_brightwellii.AAC.1